MKEYSQDIYNYAKRKMKNYHIQPTEKHLQKFFKNLEYEENIRHLTKLNPNILQVAFHKAFFLSINNQTEDQKREELLDRFEKQTL